jgi:uroporphyrinogen decarboxylase
MAATCSKAVLYGNRTRIRAAGCRNVRRVRVSAKAASDAQPLMLRALKGEEVERSPVWMMRQAGRYMKAYQELCKVHKTFRERSENVDISVEVTLQPWRAFKPDGVVLFSDILTPLTGMSVPFDFITGKGPIIQNPIRTMDDVKQITDLDAEGATPFVGEALRRVREEVGNEAAVLGFAGAPFTLASYIVEGGSSKTYSILKHMAFANPDVLHALLSRLADNITEYCCYQAANGAQVIQVFDSWAANLSPVDYDVFAAPYTKRIISGFKKSYPDVPIILYIANSGGLLERMSKCGPDCMSIDGSVDLRDAIQRCGTSLAYQGNMDPGCLYGSKEFITDRIKDTVRAAREAGVRHVMNLGHGVLPNTPEENVAHYFEVSRSLRYADLAESSAKTVAHVS